MNGFNEKCIQCPDYQKRVSVERTVTDLESSIAVSGIFSKIRRESKQELALLQRDEVLQEGYRTIPTSCEGPQVEYDDGEAGLEGEQYVQCGGNVRMPQNFTIELDK